MADGSQIALPTRQRPVRIADLFCGAGGSSTGALRALRSLGRSVELTAVNHWAVAIETHTRNHPEAIHFCADLEAARPRELVPGGRLDLLIASPTCTFHSRARGGRPVNDQQRMDPWHVVRWCTELRVARLLIENVPEFVEWGPCSLVTGRPIASRRGEYFRAWCEALRAIGFRLDHRVLCCADYGDPTTRNRFFLIGRSDGKALRWPDPTHARGGKTDLLGQRARWRSAADDVIDWSLPGRSIFTRPRPLKPNTLRRILAGAIRYGWPWPYLDALQALLEGRKPVLDFQIINDVWQHAPAPSLIMATASGGAARSVSEPVPTITTGGNGHGNARPHFITPLVVPLSNSSTKGTPRSTDEPIRTVTTAKGGDQAIAIPLVAPYYGGGSGLTSQSVDEPVPAITTKARFGLAEPFLVPSFGERQGQQPRTHSIDAPLPAITASGHIQMAQPAIEGYRIDILYRMLHWRELARAMSFDDEGEVYEFAGTSTEITKQIGNAVPGRTAKALVQALMGEKA